MTSIDLNVDLGETPDPDGARADAELLALVSSASIACGFHAGEPARMRFLVETAARLGVAIGAHPSYLDREHFGRRELSVPVEEVAAQVAYQVGALAGVCAASGAQLRFVKPHGALYNQAARDPALAQAVAVAIAAVAPNVALLGLAGSALVDAGRAAGLLSAREAFADRGYRADGSLVPRSDPGAIVQDAVIVAERAARLVQEHSVTTVDGGDIALHADSLCVHGDTPGAAGLLRAIRDRLERDGILIESFAS